MVKWENPPQCFFAHLKHWGGFNPGEGFSNWLHWSVNFLAQVNFIREQQVFIFQYIFFEKVDIY